MATNAKSETVIKASADDARFYWLDEGRTKGGFIKEIDHSKFTHGVHPLFSGIKIIDCDAHFTEPPDMFEHGVPAHLKDKMPRVVHHEGADRWFVGDENFGSYGGNVIDNNRNKLLGKLSFTSYDEIHPGAFRVKERLEEMDDMGVHAQICFQNGGVTQAGSLLALDDNELVMAIMHRYNDALAERQEQSGGRILGMAQMPYWDQKEMLSELRRVLDMGLKGVVLPDRPERVDAPYLGADGKVNPFWEEFLDICNSTGTPLNYHINASLDVNSAIWDNLRFTQRLPITSMLHTVGCCATMSNFMMSGLLDRYENLKIALTESGIGWVPFVLEMLDHQCNEMRTHEDHGLKLRPQEYFARNFWAACWFEKNALEVNIEAIGADRILWETDYPHPTSLFPGVQEWLVDTMGHLPYETRKQILQTNPATLYNIEL